MSEYIERDAAISAAIDATDEWDGGPNRERWAKINAALESIPAADVRPVVLCRDCKNNYNTCLNHGINEPMCDFTDRKLREDDFCSRGEKREES